MPLTRVLRLADLPSGSKKIVEVHGYEIALFHWDQRIFATTNICPHNGGSLGAGLLEEGTIVCPLHFWKFDLMTGKSLNQPAYRLEIYKVEVGGGWIYLDIPDEDLEE